MATGGGMALQEVVAVSQGPETPGGSGGQVGRGTVRRAVLGEQAGLEREGPSKAPVGSRSLAWGSHLGALGNVWGHLWLS